MTTEETKAWADTLNTVDNNEVLIRGTEETIGLVESMTPAQVSILTKGHGHFNTRRFWKKNGELVGEKDRWHHVSIAPLTPEKKAEILERDRRRNAIYRLEKFVKEHLQKVPTETIEAAYAILKGAINVQRGT